MAFEQKWIDRYKAEGFYKHVEWNRRYGVLVKTFDSVKGRNAVSFEAVTMDHEYDQTVGDHRQFFLFRQNAVKFMVNMGMHVDEIVSAFKRIDGCQTVYYYVESLDVQRQQRQVFG